MKKIFIIGAGLAAIGFIYYMNSKNSDGEPDASSSDIEDYVNQATDALTSNFEQTDEMTAQSNLQAFLNAIRYGEGTHSDYGYNTLCGGGTFSSYDDHPAVLGWTGLPLSAAMCKGAGLGSGCVSTAAGAYQITKPTWKSLKAKLGLTDFSPASQDAAATELIRQKGALNDVYAGRVEAAVAKVAKVWASLPGAGYQQHEVKLTVFISNYQIEGGTVA